MTLIKLNARDMVLQVLAADLTTYVEIAGLNSVTINPGENEETTDTTTYASAGEYEGQIMQRGASMKLEGFRLLDNTTGVQDPGQARVELMCTYKGEASLGKVRFRHPLDTTWKIWTCFFSLAEQGGGNNDKIGFGATITRSGASTTASVS